MLTWHIITGEYPPAIGGVSDYSQLVAEGLAAAGDEAHVWCPPLPRDAPSNRVTVHPDLGRLAWRDLRAVDRELDRCAPPRRLLVQWVPQAFGYRSMNVGFCIWLLRRARRGDRVEIMVHEPYLAFGEGGLKWTAAASVHRLMTMLLARAASRVWIAIPDWERRWRPYALGRDLSFTWLPVPSNLPTPAPEAVRRVRTRYTGNGAPIVGHMSLYAAAAMRALSTALPDVLRRSRAVVVLLGQNGDRFCRQLVREHPDLAPRLHSTGALAPGELAAHVAACDVLVQPYPDGISSRRGSAMASLALGVPLVTTTGRLTESLWSVTGAAALVSADDPHALAAEALRLLSRRRAPRSRGAWPRSLRAPVRSPAHHRRAPSRSLRRAVRIAILNWTSRPAGGVGSYLRIVIPALARLGHEVAFWHERGERPDGDPFGLPAGVLRGRSKGLGWSGRWTALGAWRSGRARLTRADRS